MKRLLVEVQVSDKGSKKPQDVEDLLEDAVSGHIHQCDDRVEEKSLFDTASPRIRVLTEDSPL